MLRLLAILAVTLLTGGAACSGCDDLGEPDLAGCGDGVVRGGEQCDGEDLGGLTCADYGFAGGELRCAASCAGVIVADCSGVADSDEGPQCGPGERAEGSACVPICTGDSYTDDSRLDFDITTVPLSVTLTRDGGPLEPADGERRGTLLFRGEVWWNAIEVDVPADGDATVELPVFPDTYEVEWKPASDDVIGPLSLGVLEVEAPTDETLDLRGLEPVQFSVTVAGEPFQDSTFDEQRAAPRGLLVLERSGTRSFVAIPLPDDGPAVVDARLDPGPYEVWWARGTEDGAIEYVDEVTVEGTGDYTVDIPLVQIEPQITLNNLPPTLTGSFDAALVLEKSEPRDHRLWAQWRPADTVTIPIDPTGKGAAWVLADSYDVRVQADSARLRGTVHLRNGMLIDRPEAARQFDVPLTRVSGKVTRNGRRVPRTQQSGTTRGRLFFERDDGSYLATEIPGSGPAEFSIGVPPGTWKVRVTGDPWSGTLPLVPTTVASSFAVGSSSVEDVEFDVPAVRFLGQLTLNGERLPDDPTAETRGNLELQAKDGNIGYNLPIPATGPALFDVLLGPAEYDVQVAQWWFAVGDSPPPNGVLPLGKWPVGTVDVSTTIQRDVDLRTFEVRLELVEHGDRLAATNSETRGELWVEDTSTGRIARRLDIPADGASQVTTTVYPGHYRVIFQPDPSLETLPLQPVVLDTLDIGEDTTERYDVGGISLRGTITVNGEPLEAGPDGRGTISFLRFPTVADTTVDADVDPDFDVTVAPGPYNVLFEPASNHPQLPNGAVLLSKNCVDVRLQTQ